MESQPPPSSAPLVVPASAPVTASILATEAQAPTPTPPVAFAEMSPLAPDVVPVASPPPFVYRPFVHSPALPPTDPRASASLILGAASIVTGFFAGVPAFLLGAFARRDLDRLRLLYPHAARRGAKTALAGMILGATGTLLSVAWIAGLSGYLYASHRASALTSPRAPVSLARAQPDAFGQIRVVDLDDSDPRPFSEQLRQEWKTAHAAGKPLLLQTTTVNCTSCVEIDMALHDEQLQRALAGATVVRVDVEAYEDDLRSLGLWQDTVPWFYRLDSSLRPIDAISADEWDDNTATNIAPILGPFSNGRLFKRRNPSPLSTSL